MTESRRYRVYLLRLWQATGKDGQPVWRAALEDARSGERCGFAHLKSPFAFLEQQTGSNRERGSPPPPTEL